MNSRLPNVPRTLKLQFSKPRPQLDANKVPIPDKYEEGKYDDFISNVKLVLPGEGWSAHALDIGELLAARYRSILAAADKDPEKKEANELGSALYMTSEHFHAQVLSLYYIDENERIYMDASVQERIYALENSLPALTDAQEEELYEDFFGYFQHSPSSIRRASKGLADRQKIRELVVI